MSEEGQSVEVTNYSPGSGQGALRTVAFGIVDQVSLLVEVKEDAVSITIGGGPENAEVPEFLRDIAEILTAIADSDLQGEESGVTS